jgi:hypothetical protein
VASPLFHCQRLEHSGRRPRAPARERLAERLMAGSSAGIIGARRASICCRNCALAALSEPTHSGTLSAPRCLAALGCMRIVGLAS